MINNVIFPWYGNHASIPSGWTRVTDLDGKFAKAWGASVAPGQTGGNATHTHTSPTHTHTINSHTHTYDLERTVASSAGADSSYATRPASGDFHTHNGNTTSAVSDGVSSTTAVTYGSASNLPPYMDVIFIKNNGGALPADLISYLNSTTIPTGWYFTDGNNSTQDLRNKYLKGAATSGNAGGTGGGTQNVHSINHGHTGNTHTHTGTSGIGSNGCVGGNTQITTAACDHTHAVTLANTTVGLDDYSGNLTTSETVEPAYLKLMAVQNKTGSLFKGMIGLYETSTSLPSGFKLCDGNNNTRDLRDKHIKVCNTSGELGNTGGANTHTHAAQSHQHTSPSSGSHTHTGGTANHNLAVIQGASGGGGAKPEQQLSHNIGNVSTTNVAYAATNTTADSSSNEPEYRTYAYIELQSLIGGASILMALVK